MALDLHKLHMPKHPRDLNVPQATCDCSRGTQKHRRGHTCMRIPQALKQAYSQGYPESVMHVQISIGSRNSAIHNDYHTSLRPSSMLEPRYPSLKVVKYKHSVWKARTRFFEATSTETMATGTSPGSRGRSDLPCHPRVPGLRK